MHSATSWKCGMSFHRDFLFNLMVMGLKIDTHAFRRTCFSCWPYLKIIANGHNAAMHFHLNHYFLWQLSVYIIIIPINKLIIMCVFSHCHTVVFVTNVVFFQHQCLFMFSSIIRTKKKTKEKRCGLISIAVRPCHFA